MKENCARIEVVQYLREEEYLVLRDERARYGLLGLLFVMTSAKIMRELAYRSKGNGGDRRQMHNESSRVGIE